MSNVYVIINEWTSVDNSTGVEVVGANFFESEQDAWDHLRMIANTFGAELPDDEYSIQLEDHKTHLQYEEYYIQELTPVG